MWSWLPIVAFTLVVGGQEVVAESEGLALEVLCALVEELPHKEDPLRRNRKVSASLGAMDRMGGSAERARKVERRLQAALDDALQRASRVFGPGKWTRDRARKARRFLRDTSQGPRALLQVGAIGFEPRPGLRAALQWSACVAGRREAAIAYGRAATGATGAPARGFAALLLVQAGRREEASEILFTLGDRGFLDHFMRAELHLDAAVRQKAHRTAKQRAIHDAQHRAIAWQAERMASPKETAP